MDFINVMLDVKASDATLAEFVPNVWFGLSAAI